MMGGSQGFLLWMERCVIPEHKAIWPPTLLPTEFFLLGDWFFKLVNKLTVSLLTTMLALKLVWKLTLEKLFYFYFSFGKQYLKYVKSAAQK